VRTYLKAVYHVDRDVDALVCSTGFAVLTPGPATQPRYVSYLAQSGPFTDCISAESVGTAYPAIAESRVGSFNVPVPTPWEQTAIVRFLDYMDRRIRRSIRAKQKLIKLLEEYRQALIHQAVTGKIDVRTGKPYPSYKDSGVPWLGEVPEHWEVRRLRTIVELRVSNVDKHSKEDEQPVRLCNYVHVYKHERIRANMDFMKATASAEEIERFRLEQGDVLITKDSEAWDDIGVPALVESSALDLISGYHLALLRPSHVVEGAFLLRALQSPQVAYQFHVEATGVTRYGLSHDAIKSALVPLPPLPEQTAIVEYLGAQTAKLDAAIAAARREIELLREYRERLIADVVTGKVDVREVAVQLPYEPPEEEAAELEPMDEAKALAEDGEDEENADLDAVAEEVGA
jgi:type I restriction enzyme S subunit